MSRVIDHMNYLLPCELCGSPAVFFYQEGEPYKVSAECYECEAGTSFYENIMDAVDEWNSRQRRIKREK